jgi:CRP-like cAMP-binding protein
LQPKFHEKGDIIAE